MPHRIEEERLNLLRRITPGKGDYRGAAIRALKTSLFLLRVILPLSFVVSLAEWLGILAKIGDLVAPAMGIFALPGEAAVVLVSGFLVGVYGGVAAMTILPFSPDQVTILSIIVLTAHNLPVESTVQHKTGTPWWLTVTARILTAAVLGWIAALALVPPPERGAMAPLVPAVATAHAPFSGFLLHWLKGAGGLTWKILVILMGLMLLTEWMREKDVYHRLARPLRPLLSAMGLTPSVAFLWVTAMVLGLAYGSGLLMEEAKEPGRYRPTDMRDLNVSIAVNHSVVEDTALLAALGANVFWITLPRFVAAAIVVRVVRLFSR